MSTGSRGPSDLYVERVLRLVEAVPQGRVLSYGALADLLGQGGPRQVGRVLALCGSAVCWWRVLRADGTHVPALQPRAMAALRAEGVALVGAPGEERVDMRCALWRPEPAEVEAALGHPTGGTGS